MPPERSSQKVIRNGACRTCRQKKSRCDGVRPVCGRCQISRKRYESMLIRGGAVIENVEMRAFLPCFENEDESPEVKSVASQHDSPLKESSSHTLLPNRRQQRRPDRNYNPQSTVISPTSHQIPATKEATACNVCTPLSDANQASPRQINTLKRVSLPDRKTLLSLIQIAFDEHRLAFVFHPGRLFERLELRADDPGFPHHAALHILVALAYAARPDLGEAAGYNSPPSPFSGAHYDHYEAARSELLQARAEGKREKAFDLARASLLMVLKAYGHGNYMETYISCAESVRFCIMLNLNHIEQGQSMLDPQIYDRSDVQPTPLDAIEEEEMRRTMLLAFSMDQMCTVATMWPSTMVEDDYAAELPRCSLSQFISTKTQQMETQTWAFQKNSTRMQDNTLFIRPSSDVEQLNIKAHLLLGKCARFVSRTARNGSLQQLTSIPNFSQFESFAASLQLEVDTLFRKTGQGQIGRVEKAGFEQWKSLAQIGPNHTSLVSFLCSKEENTLNKMMVITATVVPQACILVLHESITTVNVDSRETCMGAVNQILRNVRLFALHASDIVQRHLDIVFMIVISLTGRHLIRELELLYMDFISQRVEQGDLTASTFTNALSEQESGSNDSTISGQDNTSILEHSENILVVKIGQIQADLNVILMMLARIGEKWHMANNLRENLLTRLDFNPRIRLRSLFFSNEPFLPT